MTTPKKAKNVSLMMLQNREIGAADFKAHCLEIMDEVDRLGIEVTITKHRKPVARLVPALRRSSGFYGALRGDILYEGDIVSPIDVQWDAERDADPS